MISKKTVFILGAGAHIPYGFPGGKELMENIVALLMRAEQDSSISLGSLPQRNGVNSEIVRQRNVDTFINSLNQAGQASIDSFINANQHMTGFDVIGKIGIAQAILEAEGKFLISRSNNGAKRFDWFEYLFAKMCDGVSGLNDFFRDNKISFITFNYDRLLEHKFFNSLRYSFNIRDDQEALRMIKAMPIHHVYGSLGAYDPNSFGQINFWGSAFKSIQTIHEVIEGHSEVINSAKQELEQAEKICLLGFGFHNENISLLGLPKVVEEAASNVSVCRYGITDEEIRRVVFSNKIRRTKLQVGDKDMDALGALRNLPVFDS